MAPIRALARKHGLCTTKPGSLLKQHVPINTDQWDESRPGFLEADTVAHCGTTTEGMYVLTVNCIDLATSWREQRAVWGKGERGVLAALQDIEQTLPFPILGFDCDNGSEFLNWHIHKYYTDRTQPVKYTRSRPYHKNDNAHVSQSDAFGRRKKLDSRSSIHRISTLSPASLSTTTQRSLSLPVETGDEFLCPFY